MSFPSVKSFPQEQYPIGVASPLTCAILTLSPQARVNGDSVKARKSEKRLQTAE
jgi:hypothetical protein